MTNDMMMQNVTDFVCDVHKCGVFFRDWNAHAIRSCHGVVHRVILSGIENRTMSFNHADVQCVWVLDLLASVIQAAFLDQPQTGAAAPFLEPVTKFRERGCPLIDHYGGGDKYSRNPGDHLTGRYNEFHECPWFPLGSTADLYLSRTTNPSSTPIGDFSEFTDEPISRLLVYPAIIVLGTWKSCGGQFSTQQQIDQNSALSSDAAKSKCIPDDVLQEILDRETSQSGFF